MFFSVASYQTSLAKVKYIAAVYPRDSVYLPVP
jgi:hypothetical protein